MNKKISTTSKTWYLCSLMYLLSLATYTMSLHSGVSNGIEKALSGYPTWPFWSDSQRFYILRAIWLPGDIMGYTLINEVIISAIVVCWIFLVVQYINYKNKDLSTKSFLKDLWIFVWMYVVLGLLVIYLNYMQII